MGGRVPGAPPLDLPMVYLNSKISEGGLSDAPGAEKSPNREDGDTMTLSPRLMLAPSMAFI